MGMVRAIFFDAVGTLFHLPKGVGFHYALAGSLVGLTLDSASLERAFHTVWQEMPARPATGRARPDDDKDWWRDLVDRVLARTAPALQEMDRDAFFEAAYEHFAEAGVWELYPEVREILRALHGRFVLSVVSNFDGRLRIILERLGVSQFFRHVFVSSELGYDKPDPAIFRAAIALENFPAHEILHVGDDPVRDWQAAAAAGLQVFKLDRARNSLRDLLTEI